MKEEHAIKYLDDLAEKPANQQKLSWDMVEAIKAGRDALRQSEQLRELLRLAAADMRHNDNCDVCAFKDCQPSCDCECLECELDCKCRGCTDGDGFQWQHADRLKELGIEI